MTPIDEQFVQLFSEHCEHCPKLTHCIDAFHSITTYNCKHWDTFIRVIIPAEEYVQECIYNEFVKLQEEYQRRMQDDLFT